KLVEVGCQDLAGNDDHATRKGMIGVGSDTDMVMVDLAKKVTVDHEKLHTSADYCVYAGWTMTGWPVATWLRGQRVMQDGVITAEPGLGQWVAADVAPRGHVS